MLRLAAADETAGIARTVTTLVIMTGMIEAMEVVVDMVEAEEEASEEEEAVDEEETVVVETVYLSGWISTDLLPEQTIE